MRVTRTNDVIIKGKADSATGYLPDMEVAPDVSEIEIRWNNTVVISGLLLTGKEADIRRAGLRSQGYRKA